MLFQLLGSVFSSRKDFTRVIFRKPVQTEPFESDLPGFNTRFSLFEIEQKLEFGRGLTHEERKFYDHVKGNN